MARPADQALRPRLIEAATTLFAERGYAGTTMTEVGEVAGVTKGGVYFHFRGKEPLFFAVMDHWRTQLRELLVESPLQGTGVEALSAVVRDYLDFHFQYPAAGRLVRVLAVEMRGRFTAMLREDARDAQRALRSRLREALGRGQRDGTLFAPDPVFASFLIAASIHGVIDQWLTSPQDAAPFCDPDALAEAALAPFVTEAEPRGPRPEPDDSGTDRPGQFRSPF